MMFSIALFFEFLYFKIARVHKKEERPSSFVLKQHFFIVAAILSLVVYGFMFENLYLFIPILFVFATIVSLMVSGCSTGNICRWKASFRTETYLSVSSGFKGFDVFVHFYSLDCTRSGYPTVTML